MKTQARITIRIGSGYGSRKRKTRPNGEKIETRKFEEAF
jgi:hypothetical protein